MQSRDYHPTHARGQRPSVQGGGIRSTFSMPPVTLEGGASLLHAMPISMKFFGGTNSTRTTGSAAASAAASTPLGLSSVANVLQWLAAAAWAKARVWGSPKTHPPPSRDTSRTPLPRRPLSRHLPTPPKTLSPSRHTQPPLSRHRDTPISRHPTPSLKKPCPPLETLHLSPPRTHHLPLKTPHPPLDYSKHPPPPIGTCKRDAPSKSNALLLTSRDSAVLKFDAAM